MPVRYLSKGGIRDGTKDVSKGFNSSTIGRMLCNNQWKQVQLYAGY